MTTLWLHYDDIMTTFRLHSDKKDTKDKKDLGGGGQRGEKQGGVVITKLWSIVLDWSIDLRWLLMSGAIFISDDYVLNLQWKAAKTPPSRLSEPHQRWLCQSRCKRPQEVHDRAKLLQFSLQTIWGSVSLTCILVVWIKAKVPDVSKLVFEIWIGHYLQFIFFPLRERRKDLLKSWLFPSSNILVQLLIECMEACSHKKSRITHHNYLQ